MSDPGTLPQAGGYVGQEWYLTGGNSFNAISFLVHQIVARKAFAALVQVKSVTGGGLSSPPRVSVQPLVNQIDGLGNQEPHGTVYDLPVFRLQAGPCAVVIDPVVGDIGQAIICDRDISIVKATGSVSGPGSRRQNDWADGCYFGAFLGGPVLHYLRVTPDGITLESSIAIDINAPIVRVNGVPIT